MLSRALIDTSGKYALSGALTPTIQQIISRNSTAHAPTHTVLPVHIGSTYPTRSYSTYSKDQTKPKPHSLLSKFVENSGQHLKSLQNDQFASPPSKLEEQHRQEQERIQRLKEEISRDQEKIKRKQEELQARKQFHSHMSSLVKPVDRRTDFENGFLKPNIRGATAVFPDIQRILGQRKRKFSTTTSSPFNTLTDSQIQKILHQQFVTELSSALYEWLSEIVDKQQEIHSDKPDDSGLISTLEKLEGINEKQPDFFSLEMKQQLKRLRAISKTPDVADYDLVFSAYSIVGELVQDNYKHVNRLLEEHAASASVNPLGDERPISAVGNALGKNRQLLILRHQHTVELFKALEARLNNIGDIRGGFPCEPDDLAAIVEKHLKIDQEHPDLLSQTEKKQLEELEFISPTADETEYDIIHSACEALRQEIGINDAHVTRLMMQPPQGSHKE